MVEHQDSRLDAVFHALGDITRRRMLRSLAAGERTVSQLAEPFDMSLAAASKHIKALEGAGLIQREIQGRIHVCRLNAGPLSEADEWLRYYERFWAVRLDRLEALLRHDARIAPAPPAAPAPPNRAASALPRPPRAAARPVTAPSPTPRKRTPK